MDDILVSLKHHLLQKFQTFPPIPKVKNIVCDISCVKLIYSISIFLTFINRYFYSLFLHLNLVILSVDNVDYTKGLNYRLNAFERFLEKYPVHQGKVVLVLILQPAGGREYLQLKETLDNMVYQINMRFSTTSWTPIHCIQRPVYEEELAGHFSI